MDNKNLINKLKNLRQIHPAESWKVWQREFLLSLIEQKLVLKPLNQVQGQEKQVQEKKQRVAIIGDHLLNIFNIFKPPLNLAFQRIGIGTLVAIVVILYGFLTFAMGVKKSLPGVPLYSVKTTFEDLQLTLSFSEKARTKLQVELAGKRVLELERIVKNVPQGKEGEKRVEIAVENIHKEIVDVEDKLKIFKKEAKGEEVIKMAQYVDLKTEDYQKVLDQTKEKLPGKPIKEKIDQVSAAVEDASFQALKVLAEKVEEGKLQSREIVAKMEGKIKKTEEKINNLSKVDGEEIEKAQKTLAEAKEHLSEKRFVIALEKVKESFKLAKESVTSLSQEEVKEGPEAVSLEEPESSAVKEEATSTPSSTESELLRVISNYIYSQKEVSTSSDSLDIPDTLPTSTDFNFDEDKLKEHPVSIGE